MKMPEKDNTFFSRKFSACGMFNIVDLSDFNVIWRMWMLKPLRCRCSLYGLFVGWKKDMMFKEEEEWEETEDEEFEEEEW